MRNVILQTGGVALGAVAEWFQSLTPAEGAVLALVVGLILGVGSKHLWDRFTADDEPDVDFADVLDEETLTEGEAERQLLDDISESHKTVTAPGAVEWETRAARVGEQWTTTLYIANYADYPNDGYLSDLFEMTDVQFDLTAHITPKNQERARNELQDIADDLQVDADLEQSIRSAYLQERANEAAATYKAVENGANVFDQGCSSPCGPTRKTTSEMPSRLSRVRFGTTRRTSRRRPPSAGRTSPSSPPHQSATTSSAARRLHSAAPSARYCPRRTMRRSLREGGVEFGIHKDNQSPVVIDPFARDNGYAMFTVGDTGSGKSFSSKQNFIRSIEQSKDRIGIILEPLNNWAGVSEALDAKRITVGGTLGLNPLEIRETPEHVQRAMGEDASPFNEKLDDAMSFLTNFFALRGISLGDRRTTLELALKRAYKRQGITDDISTHSNPSPTIRDMMDVFEDMVDDPEEFVVRSDEEAGKIKEDATWLLDQLRPFEDDGRHANLGQESDFDIRDEKVIYLDLAQQEGSVDSSTALTMQLLISLVYERAKVSEKEVVFYIDEARYIMQDAASLAFLETVFRHHRHHDLSIRLVTQTVDEFFEHAESEAILDQCAVKQFHRLDGMDKAWADEFGLNYAQMRFVQDAVPGNEDAGFSEALVGVDGEWRDQGQSDAQGETGHRLRANRATASLTPRHWRESDGRGRTGVPGGH